MSIPELKQFADLGQSDFDRHAVWIGCHTADSGEPWYDDTDEETFRPWNGPPGPGPSEGMLLVRATLELADGTRFPGFVTPAFDDDDLGIQQPQIFVGGRIYGFWGGRAGVSLPVRQAFYAALGKTPEAVFPLRFTVATGLATGFVSGEVLGFYRIAGDDIEVEV